MGKVHGCPRCGSEFACSSGNWADRHPIMAVTAGLFTLTFMGMMFSVYPGAAITMVALAAIALGARAVGAERQRRARLAARADWEHAQMSAPHASPPPAHDGPWHVMTHYPTSKMRAPMKDRW